MPVSIIGGSMYVGRRVKSRGWLSGGLTGLLYIVVILILSYFITMEALSPTGLLSRLFLGFSFGCIGGMLGINS
jgi:putative membrane protein (TIGR04086 family)